jgi:hypothetical protein
MADPLSVTGLVLAVVTAVHPLEDICKRLKTRCKRYKANAGNVADLLNSCTTI